VHLADSLKAWQFCLVKLLLQMTGHVAPGWIVMMRDIHDAVTVCGIVMCTCQASQIVYSESRWSYLNMPSMKLKQIVATVVLNTVM